MAESNAVVDDMKHCYENLILIDAGANLTNKKYSRDLDAVIQRAQDSGKQSSHSPFSFRFFFHIEVRNIHESDHAMNVFLKCTIFN